MHGLPYQSFAAGSPGTRPVRCGRSSETRRKARGQEGMRNATRPVLDSATSFEGRPNTDRGTDQFPEHGFWSPKFVAHGPLLRETSRGMYPQKSPQWLCTTRFGSVEVAHSKKVAEFSGVQPFGSFPKRTHIYQESTTYSIYLGGRIQVCQLP